MAKFHNCAATVTVRKPERYGSLRAKDVSAIDLLVLGEGFFMQGIPEDPHSFNMSLYRRIFEEVREDVASEKKLDVTAPEVRAEARLRVRREFFEPDIQSWNKEKSGAIEYEAERKFSLVNGEATYLNSDGTPSPFTFNSFYERQITDKDMDVQRSYSPESHKIDLLVQSTVLSATQPIEITKFAHDHRGIRDAYTFSYDPVKNVGSIKVRNMAPDGKFLTPDEAKVKMRELFPNQISIEPETDVMILTNPQAVPVEKIRSTYERVAQEKVHVPPRNRTAQINHYANRGDVSTEISHTMHYAVHGVAREVSQTSVAVGDYIQRELHRYTGGRERIDAVPVEQIHVFSADTSIRDVILHSEKLKALSMMTPDRTYCEDEYKTDADLVGIWEHRAQDILDITPQQSHVLLEKVEETWEYMTGTQREIAFVTETGVGIGGAIAALDALALPYAHVNEIPAEPILQDEEVIVMTPGQKKLVREYIQSERADEQPSIERMEKNPGLEGINRVVLMWTKEFIRSLDHISPKHMYEAVDAKEKQILRRIIQIWDVLLLLTHSNNETPHEESENIEVSLSIEEQEHLRQFSKAIVFWYLCKLMEYYRSIHSLKKLFDDTNKILSPRVEKQKCPVGEMLKERLPEGLIQKEDGHWLLFSIIWYLNMVREQAMFQGVNPQAQNTGNNMTKTHVPMFYAHGVIYIAAPAL